MSITLFLILIIAFLIGLLFFVFFVFKKKLDDLQTTEDTQSLLLMKQSIDSLQENHNKSLHDITNNLINQLNQVTTQVNSRLKENQDAIAKSHETIGSRLEHTNKSYVQVHQKLSQIEEANKRIYDVGKDISSLQEILRAPKLRGTLGELFLGDILAQILPKDRYQLQYRFKSGEAVDAVIQFKEKLLVPVDAKFPLESFKRMIDTDDDAQKKIAKKEFLQSVKKRISEIQEKYIIPAEGTLDFALMYVPAENVYYEMIIKDQEGLNISDYAFAKKVIPVSPNSFYAYLQTILMGLKGMQIEKNTKVILANLGQMRQNLERFSQDFGVLGKHISHAKNSYDSVEKRFDKLQDKLEHTLESSDQPLLETKE